MPQTLTFTLDSGADQPIDDGLHQTLESGLRSQLSGLLIGPSAVHTCFDVPLGDRGLARVRLAHASEMAQLTDKTRIVIASSHTSRQASAVGDSDGRSAHGAHNRRTLDVPGDLAEYVASATVWSIGLGGADSATSDRFEQLVGIPKNEVLDDVIGRLHPGGLFDAWSREHYGRVIPAAIAAANSTPCILLAGDPGTGKSELAHQLPAMAAAKLTEDVAFIQLNQRLRGYGIQGRAGSEVVNFLAGLTRLAAGLRLPIIVFLDEAEAVGGLRSARDDSSGALENTAVVDALIVGLDRIRAHNGARLVFLMATNLIERVDPAVLRRATVYRFERPSAPERSALLAHALSDTVDADTLATVNQALDRADGPALTAADVMHQVVNRAVREAVAGKHPLDPERLIELAHKATATSPVARS